MAKPLSQTDFEAKIAKLNKRINDALALDKHAVAARAIKAHAQAWADQYQAGLPQE